MELHQLRYFCAVAETGSFSRAAEQSHVSQPSLSQQIMKLEDELGARLFDRLGRSVRLTDVGKTFLPRARSVLRELEVAKGDVVERKDSISGLVTVGVIPTVAPYFLPSRLTSFSRKFPQALLNVMEEITPVLLDRLRAGAIDVAILALPIRGQFSSLLSMVGAGMGVSIVPEMAIEKKSQCHYVRIADEQAVRTIGTVVLRGRSLARAHHAFLFHLRAVPPVRPQ